jgi:antitoxin ParD1/3/4
MEVDLTPDQKELIQRAVKTGRYGSAEEALRDALARWEDEERAGLELVAAFDEAEADIEAGAFTDYKGDSLPQLADELKHAARNPRPI